MGGGFLIDDDGESWPDQSSVLARRLGYPDPDFDLAAYAVRNIGFIHLRPHGGGVRVALRAEFFSRTTLTGALYAVLEMRPARIVLAVLREDTWCYEMFNDLGSFAERTEDLASDKDVTGRQPWLTQERKLKALSNPPLAKLRPLVARWRQNRGRLSDDLFATLSANGLVRRCVLARKPPTSSRLVVEHFGAGIRMLRPCEALELVGRDLDDVPDRGYGSWVAEAYATTLASRRLRLEAVRAVIRTSEAATIRARYDRLLMPWRRGDDEMFVLGISIQRELSMVA